MQRTSTPEGKPAWTLPTWQIVGAIATAIAGIAAAFGGGNLTAPKEVERKDYVTFDDAKQLIKQSNEFMTPEQAHGMALDMVREQKQLEHLTTFEPKVTNLEVNMFEIQRKLDAALEARPASDTP